MRRWTRDHGLLLANAGLFVVFFAGMALAGVRAHNADQLEHQESAVSLWGYLRTGNFVEATFENWESEFLQMGMYSSSPRSSSRGAPSESKSLDGPAPQDEDPREADNRQKVPWPVRRGGSALAVYENSLASLFFAAVRRLVRAARRRRRPRVQRRAAGPRGADRVRVGVRAHRRSSGSSRFQNWQSEFLAVAVIVGASVYLRQRGSAESKPVAEPHHATGS